MSLKKKYPVVFLLTAGLCIWNIVYLPSFFYVPFQESFNMTNEEMGTLLTMYGILAVVGYFFGGMVADKFEPKKLMVTSTISTGLLGLYMATFPSYKILLVVYMLFGITAVLLYWSAFVKSIRILGTDDEQGKLFGAFESFYGIISLVLSYAILLAFSSYIEKNGNFEYVIISYSMISIIVGIFILILYKPKKYDNNSLSNNTESKFKFEYVIKALKMPVTWINSIIVLSLFIIISGALYLNPFLNDVYFLPVTYATALGITIKYGFRMIASPIGGAMVDRYKRSSKVLIITSFLLILSLIALIILPKEPSYIILAILFVFIFCLLFNMPRSCMYVPVAETNVSVEMLGTVVGIVSTIGYCSDIFIWKLFGRLLDNHGNDGYTYIFGVLIGCAIIALITGIIYDKYLNKLQKANNSL